MKSKKTKTDATRNDRQSKRMAQLNQRARAKGWSGISEYLTAILRDKAAIPPKSNG